MGGKHRPVIPATQKADAKRLQVLEFSPLCVYVYWGGWRVKQDSSDASSQENVP